MSNEPPRKPWWLSSEEWAALWELHGGTPHCIDCGTSERLSVDHIRPRKFNGTHDLANLTFLTGHVIDAEDLPTIATVLDEREKVELTAEQLKEFIRWNKPQYAPFAEDADDEHLFILRGYYEDWIADRMLPQPEPNDTLEGIRKAFTSEIKTFLKPWMEGDFRSFQTAAHKYIGTAVRRVVGAQQGETVGKGTKWDCPQVHVLLQRPDIRRAIQGYARSQLIMDGYCPAVARALGLNGDE